MYLYMGIYKEEKQQGEDCEQGPRKRQRRLSPDKSLTDRCTEASPGNEQRWQRHRTLCEKWKTLRGAGEDAAACDLTASPGETAAPCDLTACSADDAAPGSLTACPVM